MKWLATAIGLICFASLAGQDFRFKTYTTKEGLSSNDIRSVQQDDKGFLWIGTGNGLNRFDGNAFDQFYHDPADKNTIASNEIVSLYKDKRGNIWAGSIAGISRYDPVKQEFSNYHPDSSLGKCGRLYASMLEDDKGKLWVGSWYELLIFDTLTKKFQRSGWADFAASHKPLKGNNNRIVVVNLFPKTKNEMWVLTTYGLYSVNTDTKKFTWYPYSGVDDYYGCQLNYTDETGSPWLGTYSNGLLHFNVQTNSWTKHTMPAGWNSIENFNWAYGITSVGADTLMFCSLDGLSLFHKKTAHFISQLKNDLNDPTGFPPLRTFHIYTGTGGNYWLTSSAGLVKMYKGINTFQKQDPLGKESYLNRVFQITPGHPELILFDPKRSAVLRWNEITKQSSPVLTTDGKSLNSEPTGWLRVGNYAWLSTDENFYRYDILSNKAISVKLPPPIFPSNERTIRNVVPDEEGNLWIRLRTQGIIRYDPITDKAAYAKFITPELDRSYSAIFYDKRQHCLWVAVEHGGLYKYNVRSGETKNYPLYQQEGTNPATITGIAGTADGNMYMSDATAGLYFYDKTSDSFSQLTKQDGMPGNNCNSLAIDKKGFVWIATSQGLTRYDPSTRSFLNFADDDVLPSYLSFITTADNEQFYICAGFSYYKWNSAAIPSSPTGPLYIRHITVNSKAVPVANSYTLSYYQNNITIQIGAIVTGMGRPPDIEYSFNKGSDWIKMETSHMVNFSRLSPGRYTIQVRQKGNNEQLTIHFTINFPWWKRGWFIAAALLLLLAAGAWLIRRRIQAIRKAALLKQNMAETEMMALRAQMNPHFIFNCISSIDNFIQDNDKENASAWLNKFAKLIRSILDSSKNEVVPFWKDWETLQLYLELEQLRSDNKFAVEMNADDELLNGHYRIPPLIIQPYVENAIHHGLLHRLDRNGLLKISAVLNNNQLIYTIEDNGIGRQKAAELNAVNRLNHNSYGMQMSQERIELFNRQHEDIKITDLTDNFGAPSGTKVQIILYV